VVQFFGRPADTKYMNLERLIPFYRRDSTEATGAVRVSAVTTIGAEQMPGGRAQISARTLAGEQQYLSPQLPNYNEALDLLEKFRLFCGGEIEVNPSDEWIAAREAEVRSAEEVLLAEEAARLHAEAGVEAVWSPPVGAFT
jgi:hypothetical protein